LSNLTLSLPLSLVFPPYSSPLLSLSLSFSMACTRSRVVPRSFLALPLPSLTRSHRRATRTHILRLPLSARVRHLSGLHLAGLHNISRVSCFYTAHLRPARPAQDGRRATTATPTFTCAPRSVARPRARECEGATAFCPARAAMHFHRADVNRLPALPERDCNNRRQRRRRRLNYLPDTTSARRRLLRPPIRTFLVGSFRRNCGGRDKSEIP